MMSQKTLYEVSLCGQSVSKTMKYSPKERLKNERFNCSSCIHAKPGAIGCLDVSPVKMKANNK